MHLYLDTDICEGEKDGQKMIPAKFRPNHYNLDQLFGEKLTNEGVPQTKVRVAAQPGWGASPSKGWSLCNMGGASLPRRGGSPLHQPNRPEKENHLA